MDNAGKGIVLRYGDQYFHVAGGHDTRAKQLT
jgi:hypothetical protein